MKDNRKAPEKCVVCKTRLELRKKQYVCPNSPHIRKYKGALLNYLKEGNFLEKAKELEKAERKIQEVE